MCFTRSTRLQRLNLLSGTNPSIGQTLDMAASALRRPRRVEAIKKTTFVCTEDYNLKDTQVDLNTRRRYTTILSKFEKKVNSTKIMAHFCIVTSSKRRLCQELLPDIDRSTAKETETNKTTATTTINISPSPGPTISEQGGVVAQVKRKSIRRCSVCAKKFSTRQQMVIHSRIHSGEKKFKCNECGNEFSDPSTYGRTALQCTVCHLKFNDSGNLKRHSLTHLGVRPFKCDECGNKFTQQCHLKLHIRTHTGELPFECTSCDKKFIRRDRLNEHIGKYHPKKDQN